MERIHLGETGLEVSPICLGTWQFGGDWGDIDRDKARAAVRRALELGVNFFDTAQAYGFGKSEQLLSEALGDDIRRDDVIVATKGGLRPVGEGIERDSSPDWLRRGAEESLRNLGLETIDLYQIHWPDPDVPFEETGGALRELMDQGKIRHVGVSNFSPEQMAELSGTVKVETTQPPYHLFRREIERDVLPWCQEHGIGVLVYGPLAHGLLSGRFRADTRLPDNDWRSGSELFSGDQFARNLEAVNGLRRFAQERDCTLPQLAVAWTLAHPAVHVSIVGGRRPDHIEGVAPAADIHLSKDELEEIDRILAPAAQVAGPSPESV
jgi:aryl-alcohol dehydrogenase-like predicted oxidoreductase